MPGFVHFSPLGSTDARRIHALQRRAFPPELTEPASEIRGILRNAEQYALCNLSFGLFDNDRLVGYVFAYVEDESLFHAHKEELVYIKEIALLPGYEPYLRPLIFKLYRLWAAYAPDVPLEAHARLEALAQWRRLVRVLRHFGIRLTATAEAPQRGRPPYQMLRMEPGEDAVSLADRPGTLPDERWPYDDDVSVTLVTDPRQWQALRPCWDELLGQTDDSNVFQSFDYLWQWWKYCGVWNELRIVVIRRGDAVIGIVPLMCEYLKVFGRTVRKLMFISAPMEMSRPKLLFGRDTRTCLPVLLAYLEYTSATWDILDIDEQLQGESTEALQRHFRQSRRLVAESGTICPYIEVNGTWAQFLQHLPKKMRGNVNRARRRIAALGDVHVRRVNAWPELDEAMKLHCRIEEQSWKAAQHLDLGTNMAHYLFYRALARVFGAHGQFELRRLECAGKPVASTFGLVREDVFQSLRIAHDRRYDKYSPGTVLESHELEDLFGRDVATYEFMGSFLANKLRWTSAVHETSNVHVYQRRPRLMLFFFIHFAFKRKVKALLKRTGQFDRVDRALKRFANNPFPSY